MVYVIQVCRQLSSRNICSCSTAVYKPVWHTPLLSVQWINSWWWADELSETCRVSWQNKFVKLVHLLGFITKKFVRMHGHINVKYQSFNVLPFYGESSRQKLAVVGFSRFSIHILIRSQRRTFGFHKNLDIIWRVSDYTVPPTAFLHTIIRILTIFCIHMRCL